MKNFKIKKTVPVIIYIIIKVKSNSIKGKYLGTSSISTRNQVSDKSTQCSKTPILKNASMQCGILKKMSQRSAMSIPAILQENIYEKIFTEKRLTFGT
ncbi:hypothetical protein Avbf_18863 [Armadillidium vulgare]|nr:hypothetical protein Avbf_18863 [Armadillidium vulgare]